MEIEFGTYLNQTVNWLVTSGPRIVVILVLMFAGVRLSRVAAARIFALLDRRKMDEEYRKRADTLSAVVAYALGALVVVVAALMILAELNIHIAPILAAAGVVGIAVGFGAQTLVQDVISGFFILLEDEIRVGDVVEITGKTGLVERLNLRMVVLRDMAGSVHYVRNGKIDVVTNLTKDYSYAVFDISVGARANVDEVSAVLRQVDEELRADPALRPEILAPLEILGLDRFADSTMIIKARIKTKPVKQWDIGREFNRRLKQKFDDRNIDAPFAHGPSSPGQPVPPPRAIPDRPESGGGRA